MQTTFVPPEAPDLIRELPKCDIHTHLEGSVRPETFLELAAQQGLALPFAPESVWQKVQVDGSETSLVDYLDKIAVNYPVLKSAEGLRRAAFEAAEDAHRDGVVYFELRAGPALHAHPGLPVEACIVSMLDGLCAASEQYGVVTGLIVAGLRNHDPRINVELVRAACRYQGRGAVGFDLAGDEAGYPAALHREAFALAREADLPFTVHAGEASGPENVRYAVEVLGAGRIGHGVRSIESRAVMELLRERQVLLEVCPTSNVHTGTVPSISAHPLKALHDFGIPISINDDDPITSRTRVSNELGLLHSLFGMPLETLVEIQLTTLDHSFYPDRSVVEELKGRVRAFAFRA